MKQEENISPQHIEKEIIEPQLNMLLTTDEEDERPVYIAGNFNNWVTQDKNFQMEKVGKGLYHFKFPFDFIVNLQTSVEPSLEKVPKMGSLSIILSSVYFIVIAERIYFVSVGFPW